MDSIADIWGQCLEYAALSDVGLRRANNQDSFAVGLAGNQDDFQQRGHFFMVADGMGAHAAGELASKLATDAVSLVYRKRLDQSPPEAILSAFLDANHQIHSRGQASPDFRGMGTTSTAMVLLPVGAIVAHVGDSRAYRVRADRIEQLTFDHSLVWEVRAASQLAKVEIPGYISKNIITRSLGPNAAVQVDLEGPYQAAIGDSFLLCSDGLSGQVKDDEIGLILSCLPPPEAVQALIDLANLRGGPDNITVVTARVTGSQVCQGDSSRQTSGRGLPGLKPIHPAAWTAIGVCSMLAVVFLLLGHPLAALIGLLGAFGTAVFAMTRRYTNVNRRIEIEHRHFGRGPYMACDCAPSVELLSRLSDIIAQLKNAAAAEKWPIDWSGFEQLQTKAKAAADSGDLRESAREHLRTITFLMSQLKQIRGADNVG